MIKSLVQILKNPLNALFLLIIIFIIFPILIGIFLGENLEEKLKIFLITFVISIIIFELLFRFLYRLYTGSKYMFIKKMPFEKMSVEPHPSLPYVYKRKFIGSASMDELNYPLGSNYKAAVLSTNNLGFYNGPNGDREIKIPKPKNLIRINCIGGSTTVNYITIDNKTYSYPLELEKILKAKYNKNIEVNNCGVGGYNSADLLVNYALQLVDTEPDFLIIYHAYNDIRSYLTPNFTSDYAHSRKNLGEAYWKFAIGSKIPDIPIKFINYLKNKWFLPSNVRYSLLEVISKGKVDINSDFSHGLKAYERNLQNIINICEKNNTQVILCTFAHYLHEKIKNSELHILFKKIVLEENEIMKKLAKKNNLKLVDAYSSIPKEDTNFVDSNHFTPKGMNLLAKSISEAIKIV
tara:strand:+ start:188 stop:1408 length:1221 start_codon:yes stop_codon:yes gene_type:complete